MRVTTKELASKIGVGQTEANGFIKSCKALGLVNLVDKVKSSSGRGKPSYVYELDEKVVNLLNSQYLVQ